MSRRPDMKNIHESFEDRFFVAEFMDGDERKIVGCVGYEKGEFEYTNVWCRIPQKYFRPVKKA